MDFIRKTARVMAVCVIFGFAFLIIALPQTAITGGVRGILLCGRVIIPSLFPFTMCVLFIIKCGITTAVGPIDNIILKIFGINAREFSVFLLSLVAGYPVGAKLLAECCQNGEISREKAEKMLYYCVNGGPAFIIGAVGVGVFGNKKIGFILFLCHIIAAVIMCALGRFFMPRERVKTSQISPKISIADNFVLSATAAAATVLNICAFVILFSVINAYLEGFSKNYSLFKTVLYFTEVTNAVNYTKNIFFVSFLLGFGGFCVWFQVFSAAKGIKINFLRFLLSRVSQGILSAVLTFCLIKSFGIEIEVFSSYSKFSFAALYSTPALTASLFMMLIIFVISIGNKKYNIKILEDFG